jgi:hypothetical protein
VSGVFLVALLCLGVAKLVSTRRHRGRRHGGALNGGGGPDKEPLLDRRDKQAFVAVRVGVGFIVTLAASAVLTAFYTMLLALSLVTRGGRAREGGALEATFQVLQCARTWPSWRWWHTRSASVRRRTRWLYGSTGSRRAPPPLLAVSAAASSRPPSPAARRPGASWRLAVARQAAHREEEGEMYGEKNKTDR